MSSTNKTMHGLNQWVKTDVPQMEDFNVDNQRVNNFISEISEAIASGATPQKLVETIAAHDANHVAHPDIREALSSIESPGKISDAITEHNASEISHDDIRNAVKATLPLSGGSMTGQLLAQNNTAYNTAQVRNALFSTTDLKAGSSALGSGVLYFVYE